MNKFKVSLAILALVLAVNAVNPAQILADSYSQGENQKSIMVDKKLRWINNNDFSDNIDSNQKVFYNGDIIEFKVTVQNNGKEDVNNITVKDILPGNLNLIFYPGSVEKSNGNIISWNIDKLVVGESKSYLIRAKINNVSIADKKTNEAEACTDQKVCDKDRASYFIGGKQMPVTGNSAIMINSLLGLSGVGIALGLRKLARGY